jgi:hypothetical protein
MIDDSHNKKVEQVARFIGKIHFLSESQQPFGRQAGVQPGNDQANIWSLYHG